MDINQGFDISMIAEFSIYLNLYPHQGDKEIVGTLRGFDEYVNMVLDDVVEVEVGATGKREVSES